MDPTNKKLAALRTKLQKSRKPTLVLKPKQSKFSEKEPNHDKVSDSDPKSKPKPKPATVKKTASRLVLGTKRTVKDDDVSDRKAVVSRPTLSLKPTAKQVKKVKTPDYLYTDKVLKSIDKLEYTKKDFAYSYSIQDALQQDFDRLVLTEGQTRVSVCIYNINVSSSKPFLQYLLYKYPKKHGDIMIFPYIKYKGTKDIISFSKKFIKSSIIPEFDMATECNGYIENGSNIFLFYNVGEIVNIISNNTRENKWWWALMYEMINMKSLLNFPIHSSVVDIFLKNKELIYLLDENSTPYEIPNVGYHGTYYTLAPLIESYGVRASSLYSMLGPYYYFGSFRKAVRYAGWTSTYKPRYVNDVLITDDNGKYITIDDDSNGNPGAIIRCALFLGKTKVLLNHPTDKDDISDEKLKEFESLSRKPWEYYTRKMHDYSGSWTSEYNSVYIGRVKLDNGSYFMSNPEFVVKNFDQQIILSSHRLDKSTLQPNWNANYDGYHIA